MSLTNHSSSYICEVVFVERRVIYIFFKRRLGIQGFKNCSRVANRSLVQHCYQPSLSRYTLLGEQFRGSTRTICKTVALNTRKDARPVSTRTALQIWRNHHPKLGELLRESLRSAVLLQDLSPLRNNQCPNLRVDFILNQNYRRGAALRPLV